MLSPDNPLICSGAVIALLEVTGCHHSADCIDQRTRELCSPWAAYGQYHVGACTAGNDIREGPPRTRPTRQALVQARSARQAATAQTQEPADCCLPMFGRPDVHPGFRR